MDVNFSTYLPEGFLGGALGFTGVFAIILYLIFLAYSITVYVLQAVGMYRIGKRRGIRHSWLAWVPLGNLWLLGSISDQYQYVVKGRERNRRRALLRLTVSILLISIFMSSCTVAASVSKVLGVVGSDIFMGAAAAITSISYVVVAVLSVLLAIFEYMALYDLYRSCDRRIAVVFLILSLVFSPLIPFFVFAVRNKDRGMIPKTVETPEEPVCEVAAQIEAPKEELETQKEAPATEELETSAPEQEETPATEEEDTEE